MFCRRSGLRPRRPCVGRGYAPDAGNYGTAMRPLAVVAVRRGRSPDLRGLYRVGALRARLEPRLQARLDEFVQVTVENFLRIRALDAGAQVLDAADRKSTRLNSSHSCASRMPSSACK